MIGLGARLGKRNSRSSAFVGPLDSYTSEMVEVYSPFKRVLSSYTGYGIRARRDSDNSLKWFGFNSDGSFQSSEFLDWLGGANGFAHTVKGQLNNLDVTQTSTSAQPRIGIDSNGDFYLYAPYSGFATTFMSILGLSIPCNEFTLWTVAGSQSYAFVPIMSRDDALLKERQIINYGSSLAATIQDNAVGTKASIGSTNTGVYSTVLTAGASGNKITNRLSTATGTRVTEACTINRIGIGSNAGGAFWSQNSPWYMGALWSVDKGPTSDFTALAALGKTLIPVAQ